MIRSKNGRPKYNLLIDSDVIKESAEVELLGLVVDNKPSFCFARELMTRCIVKQILS